MYVQPFHQRAVAGTQTTVSWFQIGADGEPVDPGTVTATVTRADGTVVVTGETTAGTGAGVRSFTLTAAQTVLLDQLSVAWISSGVTLATTSVDVVAAPCFSNAELRTAEPSLNDAATYPPAKIAAARLQVEAFFERVTHRRYVPGYSYEMLPSSGQFDLVVNHPEVRRVRSAVIYQDPGAAPVATLSAGEVAAIPPSPSGVVSRYLVPWFGRWVGIGYEHGFSAPSPDVKRQQMRLCRELLMAPKSQMPDNAITYNSDLGWSAVLVTPGVRGAHTSIPSVNEVLDAWTFDEVAIG